MEQFFQAYLEQFYSGIESTTEIAVNIDYDRKNKMYAQAISPENAWNAFTPSYELQNFKKQLGEAFTSINCSYVSQLEGCKKLAQQGKAIFDTKKLLTGRCSLSRASIGRKEPAVQAE